MNQPLERLVAARGAIVTRALQKRQQRALQAQNPLAQFSDVAHAGIGMSPIGLPNSTMAPSPALPPCAVAPT